MSIYIYIYIYIIPNYVQIYKRVNSSFNIQFWLLHLYGIKASIDVLLPPPQPSYISTTSLLACSNPPNDHPILVTTYSNPNSSILPPSILFSILLSPVVCLRLLRIPSSVVQWKMILMLLFKMGHKILCLLIPLKMLWVSNSYFALKGILTTISIILRLI